MCWASQVWSISMLIQRQSSRGGRVTGRVYFTLPLDHVWKCLFPYWVILCPDLLFFQNQFLKYFSWILTSLLLHALKNILFSYLKPCWRFNICSNIVPSYRTFSRDKDKPVFCLFKCSEVTSEGQSFSRAALGMGKSANTLSVNDVRLVINTDATDTWAALPLYQL